MTAVLRFVFLAFFVFVPTAHADIPAHCENDKECLIDLEGAECADGTPSFYTLTKRANAKNVLIYFEGGGGCWSKETCQSGYAQKLTRVEEGTDWNNGSGIHDARDPKNPFAKDFNIITVPYCTGDAYTGNKEMNYGTRKAPYKIRHVGYQNTLLTLEAVKQLYPTPDRLALVGCSAGGIGAYYHLRNLVQKFPQAKKYVLSDAGTPFRPPFVSEAKYKQIMVNWGAEKTLPEVTGVPMSNFGDVIRYNTRNFKEVRFGFVSSYSDKTMSFFAWALGAATPFSAVKKTIVDLADNYIGDAANAKVFYTKGDVHCHTPRALSSSASTEGDFGDWLTAMASGAHGWNNQRPDKLNDFVFEPATELPSLEEIHAQY